MATIEFIQKRIEGKEKELAKLNAKLKRIQKAKESGWEDNPYYYHEDDLKWTTRDISEAEKALADYKAQLETAQQKANSRNIPVILEFLDKWKQSVTKYYSDTFKQFPDAYKQYQEDLKRFDLTYFQERKLQREDPKAFREYDEERRAVKECFKTRFGHIEAYISREYNPDSFCRDLWIFDNQKLAKDLEEEANRKYDFIIERTNHYVGEITDASNLTIGAKGDLNGYIIGTNGKAKVQTIGAGGYNIQCFHFRTLINTMK